jgi:hypothetical protein
MAIQDESLPGWVFRVEEVSAGVFEVSAQAPGGRSVSRKGTNPDGLLEQCKEDARGMEKTV